MTPNDYLQLSQICSAFIGGLAGLAFVLGSTHRW